MIRSSKHSLKFTNNNKLNTIKKFCVHYRTLVRKYINILWNHHFKAIPSLLPSETCNSIFTSNEYDSRIKQCAAKQACSMVKAVISKRNNLLNQLRFFQSQGKDVRYLQRKIDLIAFSKPNCKNINVELDSRFVNFQKGETFDLFVEVTQIGDKRKLRLPIKKTRVSGKWSETGKLKQSIRINEKEITLYFDVSKKENNGTKTLGADQGQVTCLSLSDGQVTIKNKDGYDLSKIQDALSRRVKGSKGFAKAQEHRKNYIHWSLNQLNFSNVKEVRFEKIINIRKGKINSRKSSHWTYTLIKRKLVGLSEDKGFVFVEQDNKFRSQRCSKCGFTHKSNRLAKTFKCKSINCDYVTDSDLNAACNHEVDLIEVPVWVCKQRLNRTTGFYWLCDEVVVYQEPIVPDVTQSHIFQ
jgi:transposase